MPKKEKTGNFPICPYCNEPLDADYYLYDTEKPEVITCENCGKEYETISFRSVIFSSTLIEADE